MDTEVNQKKLLDKVKKYINNNSSCPFSDLSSYMFLGIWDHSPGWSMIKLLEKGWIFLPKFFFIFLKSFLATGFFKKYYLTGNAHINSKYKTLVLSWSFKQNFEKDGSFNDRYLKENSKNHKEILWVLVSIDNFTPKNLKDNILVIKKKNNGLFFYIVFLIKNFFSKLRLSKFSIKKLFHILPNQSLQAEKLQEIILNNIDIKNFSNILIPYEGQPFQNLLISKIKKISKNIKTIGYVHAMLPSFPSNYIYRKGSPDILLVHGVSQKEILKNDLEWPDHKLKEIESLRYREELTYDLSNKIFVPFGLFEEQIILKKFSFFLNNSADNSLPIFEILNHPTKNTSIKHINFIKRLNDILKKNEKKFNKNSNKKMSVCFGWTAAIIEAMERDIDIVHICSDIVLESFNSEMWKNFNIKKIDDYIYIYNLKTLGSYIKFGTKKNLLKESLEDIQ